MKLRKHICPVALLVVLAILSVGNHALGQVLEPPFMAPTPPSRCYGVLYFQAGAKYRNDDTFRFDVAGGGNTIVVDPGTIPFGPTTAGPFGAALQTPLSQQFNGTSAPTTWTYDNGQINSAVTPPGVVVVDSVGDVCSGTDTNWVYSVLQPELGRYTFVNSGAVHVGCAGLTVPIEIGSFSIVDPTTQVNNLASFAGTTTVTFTLALTDSLAFATNATPDINRVLNSSFWGPSFEFGYQSSNYFDVFYGFSWFNASNSMAISTTIQGQPSLVTIVDTFPFVSSDTNPWPLHNFNSSQDGSTTNIYQISPNAPLQGIFPTRQFSTAPDPTLPVMNIQENFSATAEFIPFENRFGARSWAPLWGLGRLGATLGTAIIPTYYKISSSTTYIASGLSNDVTVAPGTVLATQVGENKDWRTLYGLFVGGDLSMGNTGYFLYGSADYMWATGMSYELASVKTSFNPGGFTATMSAGIQF